MTFCAAGKNSKAVSTHHLSPFAGIIPQSGVADGQTRRRFNSGRTGALFEVMRSSVRIGDRGVPVVMSGPHLVLEVAGLFESEVVLFLLLSPSGAATN